MDEFLIPYAAQREELDREMIRLMKPHVQIIKEWDKQVLPYFMGEYISYRLLKRNGLLEKYLDHKAIQRRPAEDKEFLQILVSKAAQFAFIKLLQSPAPDFFQALDLFTGEEILLYSPSLQKSSVHDQAQMWFVLRVWNGKCWTCYGLNICLSGLTPDDIYFYASEMDPAVDSDEEIMAHVHAHPFHYFLLYDVSHVPDILTGGIPMRFVTSEDPASFPDQPNISETFECEVRDAILQMTLLAKEGEQPDKLIGTAYLDEEQKTLYRVAYSEKNFDRLTTALNAAGFDIPDEPILSVAPLMLELAERVLMRKIPLHPFEELFDDAVKIGEDPTDGMNRFMDALIPSLNAGTKPDIAQLARDNNIPLETAEAVYQHYLNLLK